MPDKPNLRQRIARMLNGPAKSAAAPLVRVYQSARFPHRTTGFGSSGDSSADGELQSSLPQLRARSRQMIRDSAYAKRARAIVVNNVIGGGMGLQAQVQTTRDTPAEPVNSAIEAAWKLWTRAEQCHTGGAFCFPDLERAAMGQVFEAGEVILRKHAVAFGGSRVPLSLELVEPERLAHHLAQVGPIDAGNELRMGVEVSKRFQRPVAYWIATEHPGDKRYGNPQRMYERVPASEIFHLRVVDRWPQTRGEPWLHTVLRKLDDMNEYSQAEVQAARDSAFYFGTIERDADPNGPPPLATEGAGTGVNEAAAPQYQIESGLIQELNPGEKFNYHAPNRPNTAIDPFLRYMLREVAAGVGVSYESLSRDYSQSNYSSSRLSLLDDRDCWRVLQKWWVRVFREPLHREWLQSAVFAGAVPQIPLQAYMGDRERYEAARFKVRGWSWIDPAKEVSAYKEAEKAGYITKSQIIEQTGNGMDFEDVVRERAREIEMLEDAEIVTDTVLPEPQEAAAPPEAAPTMDPATVKAIAYGPEAA